MLMPSILKDDFFDDFMRFPFGAYETNSLMNTDIRDTEQGYEITMDLPGMEKENIQAELKEGYLTVYASADSKKEEKDTDGNYIRRERYYGSCSRSFYVGEEITEEDIKAKFEDGTLKLMIPKKEVQPAVEQKRYIAIEG